MPKYLILKHYRGGPATTVNDHPMEEWAPDEVDAHMAFMDEFGKRLEADGELVDAQALSPGGAFVRANDEGTGPITDGPFAETKDLIAGWYVVDVDGWDRAVELAGELSLAPGKGGRPIHEWLEVRPFYGAPSGTED